MKALVYKEKSHENRPSSESLSMRRRNRTGRELRRREKNGGKESEKDYCTRRKSRPSTPSQPAETIADKKTFFFTVQHSRRSTSAACPIHR
jgi:hypothetical protein